MISFLPPDDEIRKLDRLAHVNIAFLLIVALLSFFVGAHLLEQSSSSTLAAQALIGFSGSAVAALTSSLNRYAVGFEKDNGEVFPLEAKKGEGKFSRRFSRWLFVRPFLGAIVAPVLIWGLSHFTKDPEEFAGGNQALGFTAFMAGLLAKSVLELVKNLFKNVFKS